MGCSSSSIHFPIVYHIFLLLSTVARFPNQKCVLSADFTGTPSPATICLQLPYQLIRIDPAFWRSGENPGKDQIEGCKCFHCMPDLSNGKNTDFFFMEREDPEEVVRTIIELVKTKLPRHYQTTEIQVLTPMQRGGCWGQQPESFPSGSHQSRLGRTSPRRVSLQGKRQGDADSE